MSRAFAVLALVMFLAAPAPAGTEPKGNVYRIGYLSLGSPAAEASRFDAFRQLTHFESLPDHVA